MRYINIQDVIADLPTGATTALNTKHQKVVAGNNQLRLNTIDGGNSTWGRTKATLERASKRKCWYTESKNPGCVNDVDHFRPKGKKEDNAGNTEYWYWFLAFDPENYRLSCQFANRPNFNPILNGTGGKHNHFPLLSGQIYATAKAGIATENQVLLDPCNEDDCNLLQFQPDGRPVVSNVHSANAIAVLRVEQSKLLLNLDFPTFNEDRESLYNRIKQLVERGDKYGAGPARTDIQDDLRELMHQDSQYSKAAECYVRCFRDREWVEELLV